MDKTTNILISCFACGPNWGSEVGMGWNFVIHLSQHCQLYVISESGFQKDIEEKLPQLELKYIPKFFYINIGSAGRNLFWKQGSFLFYFYYRKWQKLAYKLSKEILQTQNISLIHQLNLIGFREPGYLWKYGKEYPYIWGPIGGINQIPLNYIFHFSLKNFVFYLTKNLLNYFQLFFSIRVKKALNASKVIVSESSNTQDILKKYFNIKSFLIHDNGSFIISNSKNTNNINLLKIIWIGKIQGTKALPIALKTISKIRNLVSFHFTVIGDGPDEKKCKILAKNLDINDSCSFMGKIPQKEVMEHLRNSDLLFFTSLKEGTPAVVLEALTLGIPVLCHDSCGHGDIVNEKCGIKIPMISYRLSIVYFAEAIIKLANDKSLLMKLSDGALKEREKITWENNVSQLFKLYLNALKRFDSE